MSLDEAKAHFPNLEFHVRWRPFELNPDLPKGKGNDKMKYYESKFGPEMVRSMIPRMKTTAAEYGINMEYGGHVGNTFDSHRLIWKAYSYGGSNLQDKVVNQLFISYFEENKSLGELSVLEECASKAGYNDLAELNTFLSNSESGSEEVQQEMQQYGRTYQCTGVPMFIIDEKYKLSGAQDPSAFLRVFDKL